MVVRRLQQDISFNSSYSGSGRYDVAFVLTVAGVPLRSSLVVCLPHREIKDKKTHSWYNFVLATSICLRICSTRYHGNDDVAYAATRTYAISLRVDSATVSGSPFTTTISP
eukprot:806428-Rhodomonas_salina.1